MDFGLAESLIRKATEKAECRQESNVLDIEDVVPFPGPAA
jgi:hypothetical protein